VDANAMIGNLKDVLARWVIPVSLRTDWVPNPACTEFEVDQWAVSEFVLRRLVPRVGSRRYTQI